MTVQVLITGLSLGLVSSLHCLGMCGPLAMSLPWAHLQGRKKLLPVALYHAGRISTYTVLGLIFGLAGRHIYLAGFQQWMSIVLGLAVLLVLLLQYGVQLPLKPVLLQRYYGRLLQYAGRLWQSSSLAGYWFMGMVNGLLPCGMVYLAVVAALGTTSITHGMLLMFFFGAGTLPAFAMLLYCRTLVSLSFRNKVKKMMPLLVAVMGLALILRGLNLGIPFISPALAAGASSPAISCH